MRNTAFTSAILGLASVSGLALACPDDVSYVAYCATLYEYNDLGNAFTNCVASNSGDCSSGWNDGTTWNYWCSGSLNGYNLQEMGYNCWGDFYGQFWCQC